jgi:uncharacterized protein (DUF2384 family)
MMSAIETLLADYPGDDAWTEYRKVFQSAWLEIKDKDRFLKSLHNEDLAAVLSVTMGAHAIDWFCSPISALDGESPYSIVKRHPFGLTIVKSLLMRMPL